jgi:acetoacetyl-CoA reductase
VRREIAFYIINNDGGNMSRLAVVTGGTRGIGEAISMALQQSGYKVVANYGSNDENAQAFTSRTGIKSHKWDVSSFDACNEAIKKIEDDFGTGVEILINNAGITRDGMMHKISEDHWDDVINTNLKSCFNMSHVTIKQMRENNFGRIINISSINGLTGQVGQTNYSAAKAGVIGLTKSLARENSKKNITVNAIAPGYIRTEMVASVSEEILNNIVKQIPVGRLGEPKEIARAVLFLACDTAGFITGETLSINGGHHMD